MNGLYAVYLGIRRLLVFLFVVGLLFSLTGTVSAGERGEITLSQNTYILYRETPEDNDLFGDWVALSGDTLAVGFHWGVAIHQRDTGGADQWGMVTELPAGFANDKYVALDGDLLYANESLYARDQDGADQWGEVKSIQPGSINTAAISGDTLAVAYSDMSDLEHVDIYQKDEDGVDNWGLVKTITATDTDEWFGYDVALEGDLLLVGARDALVDGKRCGAVYLFSRDETGQDQWGQVTRLEAPDAAAGDLFGRSVDISGTRVLVGAPGKDWLGGQWIRRDVGAAYIFGQEYGGSGNWGLIKKLIPSNPRENNKMGRAVAITEQFAFISIHNYTLNKFINIYERIHPGEIFNEDWILVGDGLSSPTATLDRENLLIDGDLMVTTNCLDGSFGWHTGLVHVWMGLPTELVLDKTVSADEVAPGDALTYTLTVSNQGPNLATDLTVTDYLPNGVVLQDVHGTGWTCDSSGQEITCTLPSLAISATSAELSIEVVVGPETGWINNIATVTSYNLELSFGDNEQVELTKVAWPDADLGLSMTGGPDPVAAGDDITYALTVSNAGPSEALNLTVTDTLPVGATYQSASGDGWTCGESGGTVTCTRASLAVGDAPDIVITVTAPAAAGDITNSAVVSADTEDTNPANDSADQTLMVTLWSLYLPTVMK